MNWYRIRTSLTGIKRLATLPEEDKQACIDAYRFFQRMQAGEETETADETRAVAAYYKVLNNMLSIFDLEKLYIPPQLDDTEGLYGNQLLCEQAVLEELEPRESRTIAPPRHGLRQGTDRPPLSPRSPGAGSPATTSIPTRSRTPIEWAAECGMSDRLHFKVGNHHEPLRYESESFDGCFSVQAVWPFFKKEELADHAREMYRVLKPGARYACSEYLLTPHFDWANEEHVALHRLYLPTLAATQSMYPADVCAALEDAGFEIVTSAPSKSEAWPLCEQKRDLILMGRPGGPRPRGDPGPAAVGRGVARPPPEGRRGLDRRREGEDRGPQLADRREEARVGAPSRWVPGPPDPSGPAVRGR